MAADRRMSLVSPFARREASVISTAILVKRMARFAIVCGQEKVAGVCVNIIFAVIGGRGMERRRGMVLVDLDVSLQITYFSRQ